jgi:osmoprotectant transport system substrate-binding protein
VSPGEGKKLGTGTAQATSALVTACLLVLLLVSCGGNKSIALRIGARATPEQEILGQIYAGALKRAGYDVKGISSIETGPRDVPLTELKAGRISAYPDYLDTAVGGSRYLGIGGEDLPKNPQEAYELATAKLAKEGMTAFPPTPYSHSIRLAVLRKTAAEHHLKAISDLRGKSEKMTVLGPNHCHLTVDCLAGVERYYHVYFKGILYMPDVSKRFKALENGEFDASFVDGTDWQLARSHKFVLLEDDKHILPAGNAIFVTSTKAVEEAGEEYEKTIVAVQKGLTLPVMQRLDAEVEVDKKDPAEVAAGYLQGVKLTG